MGNAREWEEYERWLETIVASRSKHNGDGIPFFLFHNEFTFRMSRDRNRAEDGVALRRKYLNAPRNPELPGWQTEPCTVLEMLIALAIRVDNEYIGDPNRPNPGAFFWEMVENLRLIPILSAYGMRENRKKLRKWLDRGFEYNGFGSIFPLHQPRNDQREIEIWDQMNAYLFENYR